MEKVKLEIEIDKAVYDEAAALCKRYDVSISRHVEALMEANLDYIKEIDEGG